MTGRGTHPGSSGNIHLDSTMNMNRSYYSNNFSHIDFTESYMVEYCLRRPSHQIDGKNVSVTKAEPQFDEVEETAEDENMNDEANGDQEGVEDNNENENNEKEKEAAATAEAMNDVD